MSKRKVQWAVFQAVHGPLRVVRALHRGAVAQRHGGAPAQVVVGVDGQGDRAVVLDLAGASERVAGGGGVKAVGPVGAVWLCCQLDCLPRLLEPVE